MRRGDVYYFRVAIPVELSPFFSGAEFKFSLRTQDRAKARLRHHRLAYLWEGITHALEHMNTLPQLPLTKVDVLIRQYFLREVDRMSMHAEFGPQDSDFNVEAEVGDATTALEKLKKDIGHRKYDAGLVSSAQEIAADAGFTLPPPNRDAFDTLCHGLLRARAEGVRIFIAMLNGQYEDAVPKDPLFIGQSAALVPLKKGETTHTQSISNLGDRYIELKGLSWAKKTVLDNKRVLRWFLEIADADTLAVDVTPEMVRKYRDLLLDLPSNYTKAKIFDGLPLTKIVKVGREQGAPKLSPRTADKYLGMLKSFLEWVRKDGYISANPAGDISVPFKKEKALDARHPFSIEQLRTIFKSTIYTGHKSADRRFEPGTHITRDGKYWIPLVALFSGMRLGEIVQLQTKDVREQDGVWIFDVNKEEEGKSLKTLVSKRIVPVHPFLLEAGFIAFVLKVAGKNGSTGRVFADIEIGADGYASHNFSKYFSRFLKKVGAKKARTSFHSYRHNFKDALHLAGVQDSRQNALLGHSNNSAAESYGSGIPAKALNEDISKIAYQGLQLGHLINAEAQKGAAAPAAAS